MSDSLVNAGASFQKRFNTLEAQLKKHGQFFDRAWMLLSTLKLRSAQREWFGLHQSAGTALLKQQCMQLDLGIELNPRVVALGHFHLSIIVIGTYCPNTKRQTLQYHNRCKTVVCLAFFNRFT